jgi:ABC-type multidrug transport system fused ATPase/permease subunit
MRDGTIVQDGSPDELMRSGGPYHDLVRQQTLQIAKKAAA